MRRVNKQIILLSLIIATVFLSGADISANSTSTMRRLGVNKNQESMQDSKLAIENSFKNNDYNLFISTLKKLNINDNVSRDQFSVLVNAYNLFRDKKQSEAIKLLQDNKINPILMKFINNGNVNLTDAQKESLKKVADLVKQGKIQEAKSLMQSAGLPNAPIKIEKKIQAKELKDKKEEIKKAFDQARELKKQGKIDESKKVLKDAGIPDSIQDKINVASTSAENKKTGIFQSIKNLFIR